MWKDLRRRSKVLEECKTNPCKPGGSDQGYAPSSDEQPLRGHPPSGSGDHVGGHSYLQDKEIYLPQEVECNNNTKDASWCRKVTTVEDNGELNDGHMSVDGETSSRQLEGVHTTDGQRHIPNDQHRTSSEGSSSADPCFHSCHRADHKGGCLNRIVQHCADPLHDGGWMASVTIRIEPHEFDECRFDVSVNDCLWYLRARNTEERQQWIDCLEMHRQAESGYGSENSLRRHGSMLSLTSTTSLSTSSATSFKRGRGLHEKLAEMETFRDILCRQVDTLQSYFDACSSALAEQSIHDEEAAETQEGEAEQSAADTPQQRNPQRSTKTSRGFFSRIIRGKVETDDIDDVDDLDSLANGLAGITKGVPTFTDVDGTREKDIVNILQQHGAHAIDFKGESFTFKATTAGILATLSHCIELMSQREEAWKKRLEREVEKRKRVEEAYKALLQDRPKAVILHGGPDFEEGPHSRINEDEFFDAVDATLDKLEKEEEKQRTRVQTDAAEPRPPLTSLEPTHDYYEEINRVVDAHISMADMTASDVAGSALWQLIADEGEMKVYKCEMEEDGIIVDPLKAVHTIKGVTGHELCHYFWDPAYRMEWEGTVENTTLVEWFSKDTSVTHQTMRRVWPATQRDSLFWSTIRHCPSEDDEGPDYWIVVNYSTEHDDCPVAKCVRMRFNVAMICQTVVQPPENGQEITRDNLTCRIQYSANINPGGWAPASVIRIISKRELPKFLKTFTAYVQEKTIDQPIMF